MKIYTYSEARQNLATLLEEARRKGGVRIRRRDGESFVLRPERPKRSPSTSKGQTSVFSVNKSSAQSTTVERSERADNSEVSRERPVGRRLCYCR